MNKKNRMNKDSKKDKRKKLKTNIRNNMVI